MSPPWMPLHIGDYLKDTGHLTTVQHGAYILLIMHYWGTGGLPNDSKQLASIARLPLKQWSSIEPTIKAFFDGDWSHKRIEKERSIASLRYKNRARAGRLGGLEKARKNSSNATILLEQTPSKFCQPTTYKEEEKKEETSSLPKKAARKRAMPTDFVLSEADIKFARDRGWEASRIQSELERFRDHAKANGRTQVDWDASWRGWVTSSYQSKGHVNGNGFQDSARPNSAAQFARRQYEQKHGNLFGSPSSGPEERSSIVGLLSKDGC